MALPRLGFQRTIFKSPVEATEIGENPTYRKYLTIGAKVGLVSEAERDGGDYGADEIGLVLRVPRTQHSVGIISGFLAEVAGTDYEVYRVEPGARLAVYVRTLRTTAGAA